MTPPNIENISITAVVLTFIGGIITGFNPCCFSMIPAVIGYLCGYSEPSIKKCSWLSIWFAFGLAVATTIMGAIVLIAGGIFGEMPHIFRYLIALIPIVMGLNLLGVIDIKAPGLRNWKPIKTGTLGAFLTGLLFSLVLLPCATPILASILSYAATHNNIIYGSGLLFVYGTGIGIPLVIVGTSIGIFSSLRSLSQWWSVIHRISGVILLALGFYLLWKA